MAIRYIHRPFTAEHENIKISCDKDGKVTIEVYEGEEFDEVTIPAGVIYMIANMLKSTVKVQKVFDVDRKGN